MAQRNGQLAQLQAAELNARVQGAGEAAQTALGGAKLEQQGVAQAQDIAAQYGLQAQRLGAQEAMASAEMQNRANLAVLQEKLGEQELTFKENQDLRQLQAGFKNVDSDPNLTADQKYEIKSMMGPRISRMMAQEPLAK